MSEFINTIEVLGDEATMDAIIERTITEFRDNVLTGVGVYAFYGCAALETVDLPGITSIAANAKQNCSSLSALILRGSVMVTLANTNALASSAVSSGTGYIYVPAALADSYKSATNWSTYAAQIRAIEDYTDITGG